MNRLRFFEYIGIAAIAIVASALLLQVKRSDTQLSGAAAPAGFILHSASGYLTAKGPHYRLTPTGDLPVVSYDQPDEHDPTVILQPGKQFQQIEGFGGAITDASAETFYHLPEQARKEILKAYFDRNDGIGYSLCRTHINSCDFSSESYAYCEVAGDKPLDHFSIEHDRAYRIPMMKEAMKTAGEDLKFFASPWSPPAWMKTNNNMLQGGSLKPEYFQSWADYFIKFFKAYAKEGIPFWGLTVQNEPMAVQTWESCIFTAEEERDFVRDYLGPTLARNNMGDLKVIIYDHNRGVISQRAGTVFDDPEASKYVWGTGFHWYTGNHFENIKLVKEAYPDKKLLFTEGCVFPFDYNNLDDWRYRGRIW